MKRSATAIWQGSLKEGSRALSAETYLFRAKPHSFHFRFDSPATTGGQEFIAAAYDNCLAMALSDVLSAADDTHRELRVAAELILDNILVQGWSITSAHLVLVGKV